LAGFVAAATFVAVLATYLLVGDPAARECDLLAICTAPPPGETGCGPDVLGCPPPWSVRVSDVVVVACAVVLAVLSMTLVSFSERQRGKVAR
jgi:hypothetical protein